MVYLLPLFLAMSTASIVDAQMTNGFEHFYNLEYDQAISEFRALIEKQPDNPNYHNHLAQAILYREMFRAGALESELVSGTNPFLRRDKMITTPEAASQFDQEIAKSMSLSQAVIAKNADDKSALYSLGVAHGLRANFNFLVRKAWMESLKDATAARKAHNRVVELDPNYIDARLIQGLHDYIVGSLPWHWKMLGFVAGYRGDREEGMKTLRLVAEKGARNQYDAQVVLAAIYRREKRPKEALPLLNSLTSRFPRNYLFRLETVQMYSDAGDKANALSALETVEQMKRSGEHGWTTLSLEKIYYYRGNLLFWYRDFDAAVDQLRKATANATDLDPHTALMAWMRLGQASDMKGQRNEAMDAYNKAISVAPQSDVAKESRQYLNSPYRRS